MDVKRFIGEWTPANVVLGQLVDTTMETVLAYLGEQGIVPELNEKNVVPSLKNYELVNQATLAAVLGLGHVLKKKDIKAIGSYGTLVRGLHNIRGAIVTPLLPTLGHSSPPTFTRSPFTARSKVYSPLRPESIPAIY